MHRHGWPVQRSAPRPPDHRAVAIRLCSGVSWLLYVHGLEEKRIANLSNLIGYSMLTLISFMLMVTARGFVRDLQITHHLQPPWWLPRAVLIFAPVMAVLATVTALRRPSDSLERERAVSRASTTSAVYVVLSVVVYGLIASEQRSAWEPTAEKWPVYLGLAASLLLPAVALIAHARALPRWLDDGSTALPGRRSSAASTRSARGSPHKTGSVLLVLVALLVWRKTRR